MRKLLAITCTVFTVLSLSGCSNKTSDSSLATTVSADESKTRTVARGSESVKHENSEETKTESTESTELTELTESEGVTETPGPVTESDITGTVWIDTSNEGSPIGYEFQGNGNLRYGFYADGELRPFEFESTWSLENNVLTWHIKTDRSEQESVCVISVNDDGLNFGNPTDEFGNEKNICRENGKIWKGIVIK